MKSLAVFEIDGVLDCSSRAVAIAKQALRSTDWEIAFITARRLERSAETLAFLADRLKTTKHPKTASTFWCGCDTPQLTANKKVQTFQSLIRQHYQVERIVAYDNDVSVLNAYDSFVRQRGIPRSFAFYAITGGEPVVVSSSAVYAA